MLSNAAMPNTSLEINKHLEIAQRHKKFIEFLCLCVKTDPDKCPSNTFCIWIVVASYYCTIHLLDAIFEKHHKQKMASCDYDMADAKYSGYLHNLGLIDLKNEYKNLRRLVVHAKYLPADINSNYDIITNIDTTINYVVNGYLTRIERLVFQELEISQYA
jgi:hypothetical protein